LPLCGCLCCLSVCVRRGDVALRQVSTRLSVPDARVKIKTLQLILSCLTSKHRTPVRPCCPVRVPVTVPVTSRPQGRAQLINDWPACHSPPATCYVLCATRYVPLAICLCDDSRRSPRAYLLTTKNTCICCVCRCCLLVSDRSIELRNPIQIVQDSKFRPAIQAAAQEFIGSLVEFECEPDPQFGAETSFLLAPPFHTSTRRFTKTGSGQTYEKLLKKTLLQGTSRVILSETRRSRSRTCLRTGQSAVLCCAVLCCAVRLPLLPETDWPHAPVCLIWFASSCAARAIN
jgi:hypothetical protein